MTKPANITETGHTYVVAFLTVILTAIVTIPSTLWVQAREWERNDKSRIQQKEDNRPELCFIDSRWDEQGFAVVTLCNSSQSRYANVIESTLTISDPKVLAEISEVYPPPPSQGIGTKNHVDDVFFKEGVWAGNTFVYGVRLGLNVEPQGKGTDLRFAVLDSRLLHVQLIGDLDIGYEVEKGFCSHLSLGRVQIPVRESQ